MKKTHSIACLIALSTICIASTLTCANVTNPLLENKSVAASYSFSLNNSNKVLENHDSYDRVLVSGNEFTTYHHEKVKTLGNTTGYCALEPGGYIEKKHSATGLTEIYVSNYDSLKLTIETKVTSDGEVTRYTSKVDGKTSICGNYIKIINENDTDIRIGAITLYYSCGGSESDHSYGTYVPAEEPSEGKAGHDGYYHCSHCDAYFDINKKQIAKPENYSLLTLTDAIVTSVDAILNPTPFTTVDNVKTYRIAENSVVTIKANDAPTGKMFVGFDHNSVDNRVGELGIDEYQFTMPLGVDNYTAIYNTLNNNMFNKDKWSKLTYTGVTATLFDDTTVEDLEGLRGYKLVIDSSAAKASDHPANIMDTAFDSSDLDSKLVKMIFKNTSDYALTVEVSGTYFGYRASTGSVTINANSIKTQYFVVDSVLPEYTTWSFAILEDTNIASGDTATLYIVGGFAAQYTNANPKYSPTNAQFVSYNDNSQLGTLSKNSDWHGSKGRQQYFNKYGALHFCTQNDQYYQGGAVYTTISNLPSYESGTTALYFKIFNQGIGKDGYRPRVEFSIIITKGSNIGSNVLGQADVYLGDIGSSTTKQINIARDINEGDIYIWIKTGYKYESKVNDFAINALIQCAYNNVF